MKAKKPKEPCTCDACRRFQAAEAADELLFRTLGSRRYRKVPVEAHGAFINDASRELLAGRTVAARKADPSEKCLVVLWAWPHHRDDP